LAETHHFAFIIAISTYKRRGDVTGLEAETQLDAVEIVSSYSPSLGHRCKQKFYMLITLICPSVEIAERFLRSYHDWVPFRLVSTTRIAPYPPQLANVMRHHQAARL
jgi:hypothetical protein